MSDVNRGKIGATIDRAKTALLDVANRGVGLTPLKYLYSARATIDNLLFTVISGITGNIKTINSNSITNEDNIDTDTITSNNITNKEDINTDTLHSNNITNTVDISTDTLHSNNITNKVDISTDTLHSANITNTGDVYTNTIHSNTIYNTTEIFSSLITTFRLLAKESVVVGNVSITPTIPVVVPPGEPNADIAASIKTIIYGEHYTTEADLSIQAGVDKSVIVEDIKVADSLISSDKDITITAGTSDERKSVFIEDIEINNSTIKSNKDIDIQTSDNKAISISSPTRVSINALDFNGSTINTSLTEINISKRVNLHNNNGDYIAFLPQTGVNAVYTWPEPPGLILPPTTAAIPLISYEYLKYEDGELVWDVFREQVVVAVPYSIGPFLACSRTATGPGELYIADAVDIPSSFTIVEPEEFTIGIFLQSDSTGELSWNSITITVEPVEPTVTENIKKLPEIKLSVGEHIKVNGKDLIIPPPKEIKK